MPLLISNFLSNCYFTSCYYNMLHKINLDKQGFALLIVKRYDLLRFKSLGVKTLWHRIFCSPHVHLQNLKSGQMKRCSLSGSFSCGQDNQGYFKTHIVAQREDSISRRNFRVVTEAPMRLTFLLIQENHCNICKYKHSGIATGVSVSA